MGCYLYGDLTPEQLDDEIKDLRAKLKEVIAGGVITRASGKGRLIEYSRPNQSGLENLLTAACRERDRRAGVRVGGAIPVEMPDADY